MKVDKNRKPHRLKQEVHDLYGDLGAYGDDDDEAAWDVTFDDEDAAQEAATKYLHPKQAKAYFKKHHHALNIKHVKRGRLSREREESQQHQHAQHAQHAPPHHPVQHPPDQHEHHKHDHGHHHGPTHPLLKEDVPKHYKDATEMLYVLRARSGEEEEYLVDDDLVQVISDN
eukprot:PhM_4_TR13521/c0_g1_i1/m.30784